MRWSVRPFRLRRIILITLFATCHSAWGQVPDVTGLTYQRILDAALSQSYDHQRAVLATAIAEADRRVLDYENDFKLILAAGVSDYRPRTKDSAPNALTSKDRAGSLTLSKILYDFGRHSAKAEQGDLQSQIKALSAGELKLALTLKTARVFAAAVTGQETGTVARHQVEVSEGRLKEQERNYRTGLRSESDYLAAQVDLGKARLSLQRAGDDLRNARLTLQALVGNALKIGDEQELEFSANVDAYVSRAHVVVSGWRDFHSTGQQARHDLEKKTLTLDSDLVSLNKRPYITGAVAAQSGGAWGTELASIYTAQLGLTWDLPWNGQGREEQNRVALRRKDIELQELQEEQGRRDRATAGERAFRAIEQELTTVTAQEKLVTRLMLLTKQRYQGGKATAFEVSASESDHLNTQLDQYRLLSSLINAALDIADAKNVSDVAPLFRKDLR